MEQDLIRYGKYLSDLTLDTKEGCYRIRIIKLDGRVYQHIMLNGEVVKILEII